MRLLASISLLLLLFSHASAALAKTDVDTTEYRKIFLSEEDLPWMKLGQTNLISKPDKEDVSFARFHGQLVGMRVWNGSNEDTVMRLNDIRWVFPDDSSAESYFLATLHDNSESAPLIRSQPLGDDNRAYGGSLSMGGMKMVNYYSLFRVARVVCKLFASQGYSVNSQILHLDRVQQIGQQIVARIRAAHL
ncbi:MAG: hypothetical protein ABI444_08610 [Candidatus Kapaibacterium sp.]|jgi:hypothetical protein